MNNNAIYLNDIFNLKNFDISDIKLVFNMHPGTGNDHISFLSRWNSNVDISERDVGFSYWSHFGSSSKNTKNFKVGQICLGFIRLTGNKYLFITAGKITSIPDEPGPCEYKPLHEFDGYIGRLIAVIDKGNTYGRYVFNLKPFWDDKRIKVLEILSSEYKQLEFPGYSNVLLKFDELMNILTGEQHALYRSHLAAVSGIYLLTDTHSGKMYVGSAYGIDGIAQRWNCYLNTQTGNNKKLIELYNEKGVQYFKDNFKFTILEVFDKKTDSKIIINSESMWKNKLMTREFGYNNN